MKATAIAILTFLIASPAMASGTQTVPAWQWVVVVTENGRTGGTCGVAMEGRVEEIGRHADRVLVRYTPSSLSPRGTECDSGTMFFLPVAEFEGMTTRYRERAAALEEEVRVIRRLLKK